MEGDVKPTAAEIQVHDLLLDSAPDQHPAECPICEERVPATTDLFQEPTVDEATLQAQIDKLTTDLSTSTSTIEDLRSQLAGRDTEAQIDEITKERDTAVSDKEKAEAALDSVKTEFDSYKKGIEDAEAERLEADAREQLAIDRSDVVKGLGYTDDFVTDTRAAGWAKLSDADWAERLAELTETKPKASDKVDPATDPDKTVIDGQPAPVTDADTGGAGGAAPTFADYLRNRDRVAAL